MMTNGTMFKQMKVIYSFLSGGKDAKAMRH